MAERKQQPKDTESRPADDGQSRLTKTIREMADKPSPDTIAQEEVLVDEGDR
jgi:hypothetical protein